MALCHWRRKGVTHQDQEIDGKILPSILPLPPFGGQENQRFHAVSNGVKPTHGMVFNQPYDD
jgi:hypothetical protein